MPLVNEYPKDRDITDLDYLLGSDGDLSGKTRNYYIKDLKEIFGLSPNASIGDIAGLQAALDGKVDDPQVLTDVPAGAVFTDTVYTLPFADNSVNWNAAFGWGNHAGLYSLLGHTHPISDVVGLQTALDDLQSNSTGLELIDQGDGDGWRLTGRGSGPYGPIGLGAVDLSFSNMSSNDFGALGRYSFAGPGYQLASSGYYSTVLGFNIEAYSFAEVALGTYGTTYIPDSAVNFDATDRILNVGIGANSGSRADLLTGFKDGSLIAPSLTPSLITTAGNPSLLTKEYADINYADQTTIVGITGTKAEFDTALTDGDFAYQSDLTAQDLQEVYDNSTPSQILTDVTRGAFKIKRGSTSDTDNVLEILNGAGSVLLSMTGAGGAVAASVRTNILYADNLGVQFPVAGGVGLRVSGAAGVNVFEGYVGRWESDIIIKYKTDLSGSYDSRTLIDKGYADANYSDQTTIVGITGTKAQYNTSVTDGDFLFVGDAPTAHTHVEADITDLQSYLLNIVEDLTPQFGADVDAQGNSITSINTLVLNAMSAPAHAAGILFYDTDDDELSFYNSEADVKLNIGTETWVKVRNNSGVTIPSFTPVYQTGAVGNRATIAKAQADSELTSMVIGITTHQIENNTNGFITVLGTINNEDTDGSPFTETWNDAEEIFLSAVTAGALTNVAPTGNNIVVSLGNVLTATNNGSFNTKINGANVVGASSSTDNAIVRFDGTSGKRIQDSGITINDSDAISGATIDIDSNTILNIGNGELARISGSTFSTIQHLQNIFHSAGSSSGGDTTDAGGNTVDVDLGTGFIRATNSSIAEISYFDWPQSLGLSVPLNTTRYIGIEYNAGSPQVTVRTSDDFNDQSDFFLSVAVNEGGTIHIKNSSHAVGDHARNMIIRLKESMGIRRDNVMGGLILGETGTRNITMTAGGLWDRLSRFAVSSIDTSVAGTFDRYYSDGASGHTKESVQTTWNNTQYDDGTGTLATLANNRWGVQWFYIELDGALLCMYGTAQHNSLSQAEAEPVPTDIPDRLSKLSLLIGRIIFKKSDATITSIESSFTKIFGGSLITDHSSLANLDADDHTQYLLADGTRALTGNLAVDALITIDGRDLSVDGAKLDLITGTNTGDQTSIVGITGTKAQFDTAVTDGNIMYIGDAPTAHTHTFASLTSKPTTISGYGITDAYTKTEADGKYLLNTTDTLTGDLTVTGNIISQGSGKNSFVGNFGLGETDPNDELTLVSSGFISWQTANQASNSGRVARITTAAIGSGNGDLVFETYKGGSGGGEKMRLNSDGDLNVVGDATAASFNGTYTTKVSLSSAQILALNTTPIELIAAPGSGKVIHLKDVVFNYTFVTTAYTSNAGQVEYETFNDVLFSMSQLDDSASIISRSLSTHNELKENKGIEFTVLTSDPTLGDGTLDIYLIYEIITL